jgi:lipid-A-disaccharide synthase
VQPVVAAAPGIPSTAYVGIASTTDSWQLLLHARAALVKSGTTTLQAAIADTPMVVAYRMHPFTFALARRLVRVPHVALANLVAGERIAPELMQEEATPEALAAAVVARLDEGEERRRALDGLARVRTALRPADSTDVGTTAERVAAVAAGLIETR